MLSATQTQPWDVHRPPRAEGRTFLVTGGNAGSGYFVAEQLAGTGATVVLGIRDTAKAEAAMASIRSRVPGAQVRHLRVDLADLTSLKTSVDALELDSLDAVVYNAGVLLDQSQRRETKDGNELTFGTNHGTSRSPTGWRRCYRPRTEAASSPPAASPESPPGWTSTTSRPPATTSRNAPTSGRNWRRCSSASNSTAACVPPAARH
jgi:NAD(P)-dependent dehydrogenase (short-subunit alcohol dehydrogenase family)